MYIRLNALNVLHVHGPRFNVPCVSVVSIAGFLDLRSTNDFFRPLSITNKTKTQLLLEKLKKQVTLKIEKAGNHL